MATDARQVIAVLAPPEVTASTLFGMFDVFSSAGRDWDVLTRGVPGPGLFRPLVVSAEGRPFRTGNGACVCPDAALADTPLPAAVCVPDLMVAPGAPLAGRYPRETAWLRDCHARGVLVAAACTGALLLAEAGLLVDRDATTHWAYCGAMARQYPQARVHSRQALVATGPGQRLIMAGGGTSWMDLALFLIARLAGVEEAMRMARLYLVDWHREGQQPYATLTTTRQVEDAVIAQCQHWVAEHYDEAHPVHAMAGLSGLTERSFKRRFKRATGLTPMEYVHTLRLEEAKQILETTTDPVEAVAEQVGYGDASFFGRLFGRRVGLTPAQYRRRFAGMRQALQA